MSTVIVKGIRHARKSENEQRPTEPVVRNPSHANDSAGPAGQAALTPSERIEAAIAQREAERLWLLKEVDDLRRESSDREVEIAQTELQLQTLEQEIQTMLDDSTVALSSVMQKRTQVVELQGYLRGLKFKRVAADPSIS